MLRWSLLGGLVLLGLLLLLGRWAWPALPQRPQPLAPRIVFLGADSGRSAYEHRAIYSPALMALSRGGAVAASMAQAVALVSPPLDPPQAPAPLLSQPAAPHEPAASAMSTKDLLRPRDISGATELLFSRPVFEQEGLPAGGLVTVEYQGGLAGKTILLPDWSWEPWLQAGMPWSLQLELQTDAQGRIRHVWLDIPAEDSSLNRMLIKSLYQQGRVSPAGTSQGHVRINFSGRL